MARTEVDQCAVDRHGAAGSGRPAVRQRRRKQDRQLSRQRFGVGRGSALHTSGASPEQLAWRTVGFWQCTYSVYEPFFSVMRTCAD